MDNIRIGAAIRGLRQEHGLTQRQLADRLHVSAKTVSKWECGQGCPDPALWEALCACLGADLRKLLQGDLEPGRPDPGNMAKARFYVCPMCGNLLLGTGSCGVSCCGRSLTPLSPAADPEPLNLRVEEMDLDYYISWDHPMEKGHFLDFAAYVQDDRVLLIRLYPIWFFICPAFPGLFVIPGLAAGRVRHHSRIRKEISLCLPLTTRLKKAKSPRFVSCPATLCGPNLSLKTF